MCPEHIKTHFNLIRLADDASVCSEIETFLEARQSSSNPDAIFTQKHGLYCCFFPVHLGYLLCFVFFVFLTVSVLKALCNLKESSDHWKRQPCQTEHNVQRTMFLRETKNAAKAKARDKRKTQRKTTGIFSYTPEPHIAFCPIFVHPLFPVFEPPYSKNGSFLSVVAFVSVTLLDSTPRSSAEKRSNPSLARTTTIELPVCQERRGQKQFSPCFLRRRRRPKAGDAFTRTRLMLTFGVSAGRRPAMFRRKAGEGPKVGVQVFRVFRVLFRAYGLGV